MFQNKLVSQYFEYLSSIIRSKDCSRYVPEKGIISNHALPAITLLTNKAYQKRQHDELCGSHERAYSIVALVEFRLVNALKNQISIMWKFLGPKKISPSHTWNLIAQSVVPFEHEKCNYKLSNLAKTAELARLHLLVYFLFFLQRSKWCKNGGCLNDYSACLTP